MDFTIFLPVIAFFILGIVASLSQSRLEIPQPIAKFLSIYLLIAIGLKGGVEISHHPFTQEMVKLIVLVISLSIVIPFIWFFVLKNYLSVVDAAAVAATFGSVSAITFVTAIDFLQSMNIHFDGYMIAMMVLMESPPIIVGILLANVFSAQQKALNWKELLHEAFFNHAILLLLGGLVIGFVISEPGYLPLKPFFETPFKGVLTLFILDMGLMVGRRLKDVFNLGTSLMLFSFLIPFFNALIGIGLSHWMGLQPGNSLLLTILCAGASYIAVPAALSLSLPQANHSLYLTMSLALTFPFNLILGIPLYYKIIQMTAS